MHFLRIYAQGNSAQGTVLTEDAIAVLRNHPWRGNLRELRNCMERLAIMAPGHTINAEDVRLLLHHRVSEDKDLTVRRLEDIERQAIIATLEKFEGNRTRTAEALGIGRRTLQNKLKQYGIADSETSQES